MLKFLVPAIGAMLALSAALAAACFVKAFGITFLGRPRTQRRAAMRARPTRFSLTRDVRARRCCAWSPGVLPGYFIDALAPVAQTLVGAQLPQQDGARAGSRSCPIAESRSSYNGLLLFVLIAVAAWLAAYVIHRWASARDCGAPPPWDCGFPDASPATQYTAGSFAQPIRRVFGSVVFRAREEVHMPPPGDPRPARLHVHLRDLLWDALYAPVGQARRRSPPTASTGCSS